MLIHNVTIYTNDDAGVISNGAVLLDGTRIKAVGDAATLMATHSDVERLDGEGRLLMPGLSNTHMHFYGMYARGMSLNQTPYNFHEILKYLWWGLDKVLGIAKERFQMVPGSPSELIKKGSRNLIILSNLDQIAVDALIDPSVFYNFDTGLRI